MVMMVTLGRLIAVLLLVFLFPMVGASADKEEPATNVVIFIAAGSPEAVKAFTEEVLEHAKSLPNCKPTDVPKWHSFKLKDDNKKSTAAAYTCTDTTSETFATFGSVLLAVTSPERVRSGSAGPLLQNNELTLTASHICVQYTCFKGTNWYWQDQYCVSCPH
jgi:hypothetical protein